jgi:amino acid permease
VLLILSKLFFSDEITFSAFMRALKAQGIDRNTLPYKAPFQPYASWFALIFTGIVLFFNGSTYLSMCRIRADNNKQVSALFCLLHRHLSSRQWQW